MSLSAKHLASKFCTSYIWKLLTLPFLTKVRYILSGKDVYRASHEPSPVPQTPVNTQDTWVLCLYKHKTTHETCPKIFEHTMSFRDVVPYYCYWLSPACSGEMTTTLSFWTAAFAAGGGRRWSQSERSKVPGSTRSKRCIRDLQTQRVTWHIPNNEHILLMGFVHLASSRSAFCRYCSSGLVGSQLCSSK